MYLSDSFETVFLTGVTLSVQKLTGQTVMRSYSGLKTMVVNGY